MSKVATESSPKLSGLKYLVESVLSTDESGTILLINDQGALGKPYALKVLKRDGPKDDLALDFARCAFEGSRKIGHPSILRYHDFQLERSWFRVARGKLLMDYVKGKSLDQLEHATLDQLVLIFQQVAAALAHMHRRGVNHGDLRPEHIMVSKAGEVKVLGYGLNFRKNKESQPSNKLYLAPEQIRAKVIGDRTDLYSLGACMYHTMTGQAPKATPKPDGETAKLTIPAKLNPAISSALNNLIVSCLSSHPTKRPEGAYEVQKQLDAIGQKMGADPETLKELNQPRID